jgi:hypothetical protein
MLDGAYHNHGNGDLYRVWLIHGWRKPWGLRIAG